MRAGRYNIICEQGATLRRNILIEQPDLEEDPTGETFEPYHLTGYKARMQVRKTIESDLILLNLTTENGALTINPSTAINEIFIDVSASVTASVSTSGVYDIEIYDASNYVQRVLEGEFVLRPEVTR